MQCEEEVPTRLRGNPHELRQCRNLAKFYLKTHLGGKKYLCVIHTNEKRKGNGRKAHMLISAEMEMKVSSEEE